MTLDQLLTQLGVVLARDETGIVASHLVPTPLPRTIYAVVTEQSGGLEIQGHGFQARTRLCLVMFYGAAGTVAGKQQLTTLLAWFRRQASSIDRWPGLRLQSVHLADDSPVTFDAATNQHYAGQRLQLTFIQNTQEVTP